MNTKIKVLVAILAVAIVIGAGAVIRAVWSVKQEQVSQKTAIVETRKKTEAGETATAALQKSTQSAFDKVSKAITDIEKRTAVVEKQSTDTAETTTKLAKATEKALGEIDIRVGKVETQVSDDRKTLAEISNKATAATVAVEELGKRMEASRTAQAAAQNAVTTSVPVPAPAVVSATSAPVPSGPTKTITPGAPTRMKVEAEVLSPGIESKSYRMDDIKDGKIELEDSGGGPIVNTTVTVKHSFRVQKDKVLTFSPGQTIAPYSDAYSVTFTADRAITVRKRR